MTPHEGRPTEARDPLDNVQRGMGEKVGPIIGHPADWPDALIGRRVGPYKVLQLIGEGGFGYVYMAEQEQPVRRRVALKIIKLGMDTRQVIARFEAERQALAMMDHPNIARVFDAGYTTGEDTGATPGRPFFVMELVRGVPITRYCDENHLSLKDRLELFITVCQAVQHAHTKAVMHRDIKPSNVLVGTVDGRPLAKIIDFGIAKATDHRLTEKTLFTQFDRMIGTPAYMSPEQAGAALDIDMRTDVYSLGVLLYELLTGTTPFEDATLRNAAYAEIQRIIREVEPPKPSTRLSSLAGIGFKGSRGQGAEGVAQASPAVAVAQASPPVNVAQPPPAVSSPPSPPRPLEPSLTAAEIASRRRIDPGILVKSIRGDLDWIVMKALEKDRARRYDTATAFAADVRRHLSGEPVIAAPPSVGYRVRKFVRKHRGQVVAGSTIAATLLLATIGMAIAWSARGRALTVAEEKTSEAERERVRADRERDSAKSLAYSASLGAAQVAIAAENWPEAREQLNACEHDQRGWEWLYLYRRAEAIRFVIPNVTRAEFSEDGSRIVTASSDKTARLWDSKTGKQIGEPMKHDGSVNAAVFNRDGTRILTACSDGNARLWDSETLRRVGEPMKHEASVGDAKFSRDGKRIVTATGNKVLIWDSTTCKSIGQPLEHKMGVSIAYFSPDGRLILTVACETRLWNAATCKMIRVLPHQEMYLDRGPIFSPDSKTILTSTGQSLQLIDAATGNMIGQPMAYGNTSLAFKSPLAFSSDGKRIFAIASEGAFVSWDVETRQKTEFPLEIHGDSIAFGLNDASILSITSEGYAELWDMTGSFVAQGQIASSGFSYGASVSASLRHDSQFALLVCESGSSSRAIILSLLSLGRRERVLSSSESDDVDLEFRGSAGSIAPATPNESTVNEILRQAAATSLVRVHAVSTDGSRLALGLADNTIRLRSLASQREVFVLPQSQPAAELKFSPDDSRLFVKFVDNTGLVLDTRDPAELRAEQDLRRAEREWAKKYVDDVLAGPLEIDELERSIRSNESMSSLRRLVSLAELRERIPKIEQEAQNALVEIKKKCISTVSVRAAVERSGLSWRVRAALQKKADAWRPKPNDLNQFAWNIVRPAGASPEQLAEALTAIQEAQRQNPDDGFFLNTLGVALYRTGALAEALKTLTRSSELNPVQKKKDFVEDWAFIAMCQFRLGHRAEADRAISRLRELLNARSHVDGQVSNQRLEFHYDYDDGMEGKSRGQASIELAQAGESFAGKWRDEGEEEWSDFSGQRKAGQAQSGFTGFWSSSIGDIWLFQDGDKVHGWFKFDACVSEAITLIQGPTPTSLPASRPTTTAPASQPATSKPARTTAATQPASATTQTQPQAAVPQATTRPVGAEE